MLRKIVICLLMLIAMGLTATDSNACGQKSDCRVGDRVYRIFVPDSYEKNGEAGAIVFLHGYRGTANGTMRNSALISLAKKLEVPLIGIYQVRPVIKLQETTTNSTILIR